MSSELIGVLGFLVMLLLMIIRVPVALAMLLVGFFGFSFITSFDSAISVLKGVPVDVLSNYDFSAIPLFILMGVLAAKSGMASSLFSSVRTIFGGFRGGLAIAAVGSCGIFSSISGSSLATASTMTKIALPEMEKYGYNRGLATGALAAGGTLGIMIPPSIALLLYAIMTEQSVGDMFIAGFIPGQIGLLMYMLTVFLVVKLRPDYAEKGFSTTLKEKFLAIFGLIPFAIVFLIIIAGIYFGIFTPTEGAAIGAFVTLVYALVKGAGLKGLLDALFETLALSSVVFFMLIGAETLGYFISVSRISFTISAWIGGLDVPAMVVILAILLMYLLLGMFMDAIAMLVITVPVVYPVIVSLGIDPIWFGIISVLTVELGLITPPVGMNVFVIKAMAPHIPLGEMFKGVLPFIISDFLRLAILLAFPILSVGLIS